MLCAEEEPLRLLDELLRLLDKPCIWRRPPVLYPPLQLWLHSLLVSFFRRWVCKAHNYPFTFFYFHHRVSLISEELRHLYLRRCLRKAAMAWPISAGESS